jgi:predicted Zn-dependent peptidase
MRLFLQAVILITFLLLSRVLFAASPINITITYPIGSIHDSHPGEAHLVEHLKFKTSTAHKSGVYENIPGASFNASTHYDKTVYKFRASQNNLPTILKTYRDISTPLDVTQADFEREKQIVKQEILQRTRSHPDTVHYLRSKRQLYQGTRLAHGPVGRLKAIEAMSLDEVKRWNDVHYIPSKALVLISGELDRNDVVNIAREILPSDKFTVLVIDTRNPPKKADPELINQPALVPDSGINIGMREPFETMAVSDRVHSVNFSWARIYPAGKNWRQFVDTKQLLQKAINSRLPEGLHERIAEDDRIVRSWSLSISIPTDGYWSLRFSGTLADGASVGKVKQAVDSYLASLTRDGISEKSFTRVKKRMKSALARKWQNPDAAASNFANDMAFYGYKFAWQWPQIVEAIKRDDITRFLRTLKKPVREGTLILKPREKTDD